jgi:hypothetical protein
LKIKDKVGISMPVSNGYLVLDVRRYKIVFTKERYVNNMLMYQQKDIDVLSNN